MNISIALLHPSIPVSRTHTVLQPPRDFAFDALMAMGFGCWH